MEMFWGWSELFHIFSCCPFTSSLISPLFPHHCSVIFCISAMNSISFFCIWNKTWDWFSNPDWRASACHSAQTNEDVASSQGTHPNSDHIYSEVCSLIHFLFLVLGDIDWISWTFNVLLNVIFWRCWRNETKWLCYVFFIVC